MPARSRSSIHMRASLALTLSAITMVGCFEHPNDKVSQMTCTTDNNCPIGYQCNPARKCVTSGTVGAGGQGSGGQAGGSGGSTASGVSDASQGGGAGRSADARQTAGAGGAWADAPQTTSANGGGAGQKDSGASGSGGQATGGAAADSAATGGASGGGDLTGGGGIGGSSSPVDAPVTGGSPSTGGVVGSGGVASTGGIASTGGTVAIPDCTMGTHSCSGNTLLTCDSNGMWPTNGTACQYVCRNNTCAGQCKPNDHSCSGESLLVCDANGNWPSTGSACPYVCRGNACTGVCKPNDHTCSGDTQLTCDVNGSWPTTGTACPYVCRNNACTGQCKPNDVKCSGNIVVTCDSNGSWPTTGTTCDAGYTCTTATSPASCVCSLTKCADGRCIDTSSDPMNCGACDRACPGQCSSGACKCTSQSPSNLEVNGGFDSSVATWSSPSTDLTVAFSTLDASSCATSGSLLITYTGPVGTTESANTKCMAISSSTTYNMGGWFYAPSGYDRCTGTISVGWYDATCSVLISPGAVFVASSEKCDVWQYLHKESLVPPSGAGGAVIFPWVDRVTAGASAGRGYYDSLYLTPAPGRF